MTGVSMVIAAMATMLSVAPLAPPAMDTVFAVERDTRLSIEAPNGRVVVEAWDRSSVRVRADRPTGSSVEVGRSGALVRIRPRGPHSAPDWGEVRVSVPRWMAVRIGGQRVTASVRGTDAEVLIETLGGDVVVDGGRGLVSVRTIQGSVTVGRTRGRVEVVTVNEGVLIEDVTGDVSVETTNGGVTLRRIASSNARATTVNGSVSFDGAIRDDGRYSLSTHNGSVTVTVPASVNATVSVATYHGDFQSDFPVELTGTVRDHHFNFTLGSGSARVELESFNGAIRLRRPR